MCVFNASAKSRINVSLGRDSHLRQNPSTPRRTIWYIRYTVTIALIFSYEHRRDVRWGWLLRMDKDERHIFGCETGNTETVRSSKPPEVFVHINGIHLQQPALSYHTSTIDMTDLRELETPKEILHGCNRQVMIRVFAGHNKIYHRAQAENVVRALKNIKLNTWITIAYAGKSRTWWTANRGASEIRDFQVQVRVEEEVVRRYITMDDIVMVKQLDTFSRLSCPFAPHAIVYWLVISSYKIAKAPVFEILKCQATGDRVPINQLWYARMAIETFINMGLDTHTLPVALIQARGVWVRQRCLSRISWWQTF